MAFSVLIPRILSDKTCPFRFPRQRRPNAQLEVSPSAYTIQQGGINQNPNFSISQSINALFPLLPTILTEKIILMISRQLVPLVEVFLKFFAIL